MGIHSILPVLYFVVFAGGGALFTGGFTSTVSHKNTRKALLNKRGGNQAEFFPKAGKPTATGLSFCEVDQWFIMLFAVSMFMLYAVIPRIFC